MLWCTYMISCAERAADRAATLASLARSDWGQAPELVLDDGAGATKLERISRTWTRMLDRAARCSRDAVLLLEDDLRFDPALRQKVEMWLPFVKVLARRSYRDPSAGFFFGTLYNNSAPIFQVAAGPGWAIGPGDFFWGGQAIVTTPATIRAVLGVPCAYAYPDECLGKAMAKVTPIYYHVPSLVRHVGVSTWNPLRQFVPYPVGG